MRTQFIQPKSYCHSTKMYHQEVHVLMNSWIDLIKSFFKSSGIIMVIVWGSTRSPMMNRDELKDCLWHAYGRPMSSQRHINASEDRAHHRAHITQVFSLGHKTKYHLNNEVDL